MDMMPIKPIKTELVKPTTGTANDGGSKSQSGYIPVGGGKGETKESDEFKRLFGAEPVFEEKNGLEGIKEFLKSIINAILSFLGIKKPA